MRRIVEYPAEAKSALIAASQELKQSHCAGVMRTIRWARDERIRAEDLGCFCCSSHPDDRPLPGPDWLGLQVRLAEPVVRHCLRLSVEKDTVTPHHMQVAEEAVLVSTEGKDRDRHRDAHVDAHHAAMDAPGELPGVVSALGKD